MPLGLRRGANLRLERHLLFFSAVLAAACLAYIPYTPQPIVPDIPAVAIPLAVSLGLVVFTVRVHPRRYERGQVAYIVGYGWIGLLVATAIGGWWLAIQLSTGMPVGGVFDEILTVVAVGVGTGVVVGNHHNKTQGSHTQDGDHGPVAVIHRQQDGRPPDRDRVLEEAYWTGRQSEEAIFEAVVETLAEVEGLDPTEIGPLYDHINPDTFTTLRRQENSHWQVTFFTDRYEVRVSSQGTVTVYGTVRGEPSMNDATRR